MHDCAEEGVIADGEETRKRLVHELSALVALAVAGLFTLSFVCIAIIATAWQTPWAGAASTPPTPTWCSATAS